MKQNRYPSYHKEIVELSGIGKLAKGNGVKGDGLIGCCSKQCKETHQTTPKPLLRLGSVRNLI